LPLPDSAVYRKQLIRLGETALTVLEDAYMRIGEKITGFTRLAVGLGLLGGLVAVSGSHSAAAQGKQPTTTQSLPAGVAAPGLPPPGPAGLWIDHTGRGAVEIVPCADGLCGRIVWMKEPNDKSGKPLLDRQNEDRARRGSPICGLQIIGGLKQQADGSWDRGWIYDPEQGESFDLEMRLLKEETLQVKGYKGFKFLSETFRWVRTAETPGPRCAS
jgi:uncharacterized protein (DUF2147 family)